MSLWNDAFLNSELSKPTSIFGLKLWVVIGICVGAFIVLILFLLSLCLTSRIRRRHHRRLRHKPYSSYAPAGDATPVVSKEIQEIVHPDNRAAAAAASAVPAPSAAEIQIDIGGKSEHKIVFSDQRTSTQVSGESRSTDAGGSTVGPPEVSHLGWGHWYTLRELEEATDYLADSNVIGEGGYGIVYKGLLADNTVIAIKNLLNNRGQAEREFRVEVEAIGRVRHKNLVRLLGYCMEGAYRMLVYEYIDNGNLDQWLHGDVGEFSPMTWDIRMNIILGTAKGYVAPEYASTGMLNERSDVYSFGVLIMEIISGRVPVDYSALVEWLKTMVGERKSEQVVDPKLREKPSPKALKRALLVALRCVDPDAQKRPKMGHVIHMFEMDDLLFRDDKKVGREPSSSNRDLPPESQVGRSAVKQLVERYDGGESGVNNNRGHPTGWR
ncbi:putative serine/threonine-protein kinase [Acorus calamus]|uniref:non-specific serine/threonine protein kinase n=1 Tax=Acorus calamus TaxID=4465 RepID=A0AAV9F882_ACOCL|nr:putative serine/threonine-protein kinase [Acorus calamus]